jgi:hypothetical protein
MEGHQRSAKYLNYDAINISSLINILPRIVKSYDSSHQNITMYRKSEIRVGVNLMGS